MPVSAHKFQNGELADVLLPVRGYSVEELKEMENEKRKLKIKREQEELERQRQEAYEEIVNNAAQAMIPAQFDFNASSSAGTAHSNASCVITYDAMGEKIALPGKVASSFRAVEYVAFAAQYSQNAHSISLQQELVPVGTAPASAFIEEKILNVEPDEVDNDLVEEEDLLGRTLLGSSDDEVAETDAVRPNGQDIRRRQVLADEVWEEEIENAREMEVAQSLSELQERVAALENAKAKELLETEEILSAAPDSRLRSEKLDGTGAGVHQRKLDGKTNPASAWAFFYFSNTYLFPETIQEFRSLLTCLLLTSLRSLDMRSRLFQSLTRVRRLLCLQLTTRPRLMESLSCGEKNWQTKLKICCPVQPPAEFRLLMGTVFGSRNPD